MHYSPYFSDVLEIATPASIGSLDPLAEQVWLKCKPSTLGKRNEYGALDSDVVTIIETIFGRQDPQYTPPTGDILTRKTSRPVGIKVSGGMVYLVFESPDNLASPTGSDEDYTLFDVRCGSLKLFRDLVESIMELGGLNGVESASVRAMIDFTYSSVPTILPHPAYTTMFLGQCFNRKKYREAV